ncbi:hypothetical protein Cal6303_4015 [Calothrix sp. PCC 6303]|nr:hypothetical protein Cal6303_4015 [Calothrix sp. PCC 6303]
MPAVRSLKVPKINLQILNLSNYVLLIWVEVSVKFASAREFTRNCFPQNSINKRFLLLKTIFDLQIV